MEKLVYVVWKPAADSDLAFASQLRERVARQLEALGARGLTLHLVDADVKHALRARITRLDPPVSGLVSFRLDAADERAPLERLLIAATSRLAGYLVVESVPLRNTRQRAPLGERTPGIIMAALIERPERLSFEAWIAHWHGPHREVALATQCTFTDPMRWYKAEGSPETLQRNVKRMVESCKAFLDLDRVESHPMSEYRIGE